MAALWQPRGSLAAPYLYDGGPWAAYPGTNLCTNRQHSAAFVTDPGATVEAAADRPGAKCRAMLPQRSSNATTASQSIANAATPIVLKVGAAVAVGKAADAPADSDLRWLRCPGRRL